MTSWEERLGEHPVTEALDSLELAATAAKDGLEGSEQMMPAAESLGRVGHVVGFLKERLSRVDPLLVTVADLDAVKAAATDASAQVAAFLSSKDVNALQQVNATLDKVIRQSGNIPQVTTVADGKGLRDTLQKFHEDSIRHIEAIAARVPQTEAKAAAVETSLKGLEEAIKADKARLDQAITQHQQQFSETQSTRQQTFDAAETERQKKANAAESEWAQRLQALETKSKDELATALKAAKDEQEEFRKARSASAEGTIEELNTQLEAAKKIVGLIGGTGMAGGYQKDANSERKAGWLWSLITICAFGGLIGFAIALFVATTGDTEFSWPHLFARFVAVAAFGFFAAFASQRARGHRESERRHRHKQLALESMDAFIDSLEPDVQKTIKLQIAEAFFTRTEAASTSATDSDRLPMKEVLDLLKQALTKPR